jgi:hypothetical protein
MSDIRIELPPWVGLALFGQHYWFVLVPAALALGGTLVLAADGALRRLYVTHETRMVIAGEALYDHVILDGTGLTAELAEPTLVAGVMLPKDTVVHLDPATGEVEATTRSLIADP